MADLDCQAAFNQEMSALNEISKTSKDILSLLQRINNEYKTTIILATHNEEITKMSNITIRLKDGVICQEIENYKIMDAQELEW